MKELFLVAATAFFCYMYHYEDEFGMFISFFPVALIVMNDIYKAGHKWANKKSDSTANTDAQNK